MDKQLFEDEIKQAREKNVKPFVTETLKTMLKNDIKLGDAAYVYNRVLQIIGETLKKVDFKSEKIEKERRAFLDVLIDGLKKQKFTLQDELKQAKKGLKSDDKEEKKKAKERLSILERVRDKKPKDATEERYIECEPVAQHVVDLILDKDWLLKDDNYIKKAIEFDNELLIKANAYGCANALFEKVGYALEMHYADANEKFWGENKRKLRVSKIDKKLKE